jgi:hypothetical protein
MYFARKDKTSTAKASKAYIAEFLCQKKMNFALHVRKSLNIYLYKSVLF